MFYLLQINLKITVDLFFSFLYFHNRQDIIIQVIIIIVPSPILGVESNIFLKKNISIWYLAEIPIRRLMRLGFIICVLSFNNRQTYYYYRTFSILRGWNQYFQKKIYLLMILLYLLSTYLIIWRTMEKKKYNTVTYLRNCETLQKVTTCGEKDFWWIHTHTRTHTHTQTDKTRRVGWAALSKWRRHQTGTSTHGCGNFYYLVVPHGQTGVVQSSININDVSW